MTLPPIDAHAHIETTVAAADLLGLGALVVAVTRERSEWERALLRRDDMAIWGIGVHPAFSEEVARFDPDAFRLAAERALFIGEVGLDGRTSTPLKAQREVFGHVLAAAADVPRPTTIHSVSACRQVLGALNACPIPAPILHWWRGDADETREAIELGCFFSLNGAEAKRPKVIDLLPPDRVLTETDYPHSKRSDRAATQPAAVGTIENALMSRWDLDLLGVRRRLWGNLAEVYERCDLSDRLPSLVQDTMVAAGLD